MRRIIETIRNEPSIKAIDVRRHSKLEAYASGKTILNQNFKRLMVPIYSKFHLFRNVSSLCAATMDFLWSLVFMEAIE